MTRVGTMAVALALAAGLAFADEKEDVAKAAKKASELESYSFKMALEIEGAPMPMDPIEFTGKHQKDVGTYISGSAMGRDIEAYKKGEKVASKNQDGEWQLGGPGGRGRGMGGELKAPHEEIAGVEKKFKEIKKKDAKEAVDGKDCSVYEGDLTDEGAKDVLPGGLGRMAGAAAEISGKAKVFVDADGLARKYVFVITVKASFQGNDLEITTTRAVDLKDIGSTKVELPEDVKKLFEEKKDVPSTDEKKDEPKKEDKKDY